MKNQNQLFADGSENWNQNGLTKLEYLVAHNTTAAIKLLDGVGVIDILESIGCSNEAYSFEKHYPKYLAKIQILLAKELIKQLENDI